ncbi:MAG: hypothetical protein AAF652_07440, partial [Cyanobacteria bacterium P01_C01_bin.72]
MRPTEPQPVRSKLLRRARANSPFAEKRKQSNFFDEVTFCEIEINFGGDLGCFVLKKWTLKFWYSNSRVGEVYFATCGTARSATSPFGLAPRRGAGA